MVCPNSCPASTGVVLGNDPPHPGFYAVSAKFAKLQLGRKEDDQSGAAHAGGTDCHGHRSASRQVQALCASRGRCFSTISRWRTVAGATRVPSFPGWSGSAPESILFKTPGRVVPVYNVNTTLESYFQNGNQAAGPLEEDDRLPAGFFADKPTEPVTPDRTIVFGTESCVGCHYSAVPSSPSSATKTAISCAMKTRLKVPMYGERANFGQTGSADYYWQFQFKARQKQKPPQKQ